MQYILLRVILLRWPVYAGLSVLTLFSCMAPDWFGITDHTATAQLLKLFGGIPYGYSVEKNGIPLHYLILVFSIASLIGLSSEEELTTSGGLILLRYGKSRYFLHRSIIQFVGFVFYLILTCTIIIVFSVINGNALWDTKTKNILSGFFFQSVPILSVLQQLILTLNLFIGSVYGLFTFASIMTAFLAIQGEIPVLDRLFLLRTGAFIDSKTPWLLISMTIIWVCSLWIGLQKMRRMEILLKKK